MRRAPWEVPRERDDLHERRGAFLVIPCLRRRAFSARLNAPALVRSAGLPGAIESIMLDVIRRSRLWRRERLDVAHELIAHFADGLEAGRSPEALVKDFGDAATAARLIRRARKRLRPVWWRSLRRIEQGCALFILLLIAIYGVLMIRFHIGSPAPTVDYVSQVNAAALASAPEDRAWPVYREALVRFAADPWPAISRPRPGDQDWAAYTEWLERHAETFALVRAAARKPALGFAATVKVHPDDHILWPQPPGEDEGTVDETSANMLMSIRLRHLQMLRPLSTQLLDDARRRASMHTDESEHSDRLVIENMCAALAIAEHLTEIPVFINDLVALSIYRGVLDLTGQLLTDDPERWSVEELRLLAHAIGGFMAGDPRARVEHERLLFQDVLQHAYTDNGAGDGRLTADGWRSLSQLTEIFHSTQPAGSSMGLHDVVSTDLLGPAISSIMAGRRAMLAKYDELLDMILIESRVPLWQWDERPCQDVINTMHASPLTRQRYWLVLLLMPALNKTNDHTEYTRQLRDAALTAIALTVHHRRHGEWPATIEELVPSLLPTLPLDRHDGRAIKYRLRDGRPLLYSVGNDRVDHGGVASKSPGQVAVMSWRSSSAQMVRDGITQEHDWILWPVPE